MLQSNKSKINKILFFIFVSVVFILPLLKLFQMSFISDNQFSLDNFTQLFNEERTYTAIKNTIFIACFSTLIATFLGTILAYLVAYTDIKYKKMIQVLIIAPSVIPSYIITISLSTLFSKNGFINNILTFFGFESISMYSYFGIILSLSICITPIVYLLTITTLRKLPLDLENASLAAGHSLAHTMFKINLKQAIPTIAAGAILAFLSSIDNFSIPAFLGTPSGIPVLSTYIYEKVIAFGPSSFNLAAGLSVILAIIALVATVLQLKLNKKTSAIDVQKEDYSLRIPLKKYRFFIQTLTLVSLLFVNIVPLFTMFIKSFQKGYSDNYFENFSLENYRFILTNDGVLNGFITSLVLAFLTSIICIIIGTIIAYMKVRTNGKLVNFIEQSVSFTYAIPGVVLALSMIFYWGSNNLIYGTTRILLIAYVTRYLILQVKGSVVAINSVDVSLEEVSLVSSVSKLITYIKILIPLIKKQVLSSTFLIFVACLTELSLSSLLASAGSKTIGLTIFGFQQAGDYSSSYALSSLLLIMIFIVYLLSVVLKRKWKK